MNEQMRAQWRTLALVLLLIGALLPPVGIGWGSVGLAMCAIPAVVGLLGPARTKKGAAFVIVTLGFAVAFALYSHDPSFSYASEKTHRLWSLTLPSTLVAVVLIRDWRDVRRFGAAWIVVSGALALAIVAGFGTGANVQGRATGFGDSNPIWLARALATGIVATAWFGWNRRLRPVVAALVALVLAVALYKTGSRGPLIGAFVGVGFVAVTTRRGRSVRLPLMLIVGVISLIILTSSASFAESRIGELFQDSNSQVGEDRLALWSRTWEIIRGNPGGIGFGNWAEHVNTTLFYPHDFWLEILAEFGVGVGACVIGMVAWAVLRLVKSPPETSEKSLLIGFLTCELVAVSTSGDFNARTLWALVAISWASATLAAQGKSPDAGSISAMTKVDHGQK